jgi:hypothetical protein
MKYRKKAGEIWDEINKIKIYKIWETTDLDRRNMKYMRKGRFRAKG